MIQSGVCGKVLSCMLFSGIFDSCRVDFIQSPKGFIVFFLSKCCLYFRLNGAVISWERFQALWSIGEPVFYILV